MIVPPSSACSPNGSERTIRIVAEGTPDQLKREISGDAVMVTVDGRREEALELLRAQPFVRETAVEGEVVHLYVESGERAMPQIMRLLDGAGIGLETIALTRPSLDDVFLRKTGRSLREVAS